MGGSRSGRSSGWGRYRVESYHSLNVNCLNKAGCLQPNGMRGWQWTRDGEAGASITLWAEADWLHLYYRMRGGSGAWEDIAEAVPIVRAPCRFGGERPYFVCPGMVAGVACGRRVIKLYGPNRFLCRHCNRLAYASQSEDDWGRALRRVNKVRQRLGGAPGLPARFLSRPKGMWQRTFERLRAQAMEAEMLENNALVVQVGRWFER